jgi:hypothetical protein
MSLKLQITSLGVHLFRNMHGLLEDFVTDYVVANKKLGMNTTQIFDQDRFQAKILKWDLPLTSLQPC